MFLDQERNILHQLGKEKFSYVFLQNMFERKNTSFYKIQINWIDQVFIINKAAKLFVFMENIFERKNTSLYKMQIKWIDQGSLKQLTDFMAQILCKSFTAKHVLQKGIIQNQREFLGETCVTIIRVIDLFTC